MVLLSPEIVDCSMLSAASPNLSMLSVIFWTFCSSCWIPSSLSASSFVISSRRLFIFSATMVATRSAKFSITDSLISIFNNFAVFCSSHEELFCGLSTLCNIVHGAKQRFIVLGATLRLYNCSRRDAAAVHCAVFRLCEQWRCVSLG